jgi:hypothetical protein
MMTKMIKSTNAVMAATLADSSPHSLRGLAKNNRNFNVL